MFGRKWSLCRLNTWESKAKPEACFGLNSVTLFKSTLVYFPLENTSCLVNIIWSLMIQGQADSESPLRTWIIIVP